MTDEPFDITWDESDEATGESLVNYAATVIKLQRENERLRTEQDSYRGVVDAARRFAYPRPGDTEGYHRAAIRRTHHSGIVRKTDHSDPNDSGCTHRTGGH